MKATELLADIVLISFSASLSALLVTMPTRTMISYLKILQDCA